MGMNMLKPIKPLPKIPARVVYSVKLPSGATFTRVATANADGLESSPDVFRVVKQSIRG